VGLEDDLNKGSGMLLCGLFVEAHASSVITADVKDPQFYAAIFSGDDAAAPDMTAQELQQARRYILQGEGTPPLAGGGAGPRSLPNVLPPTDRRRSIGSWQCAASRTLRTAIDDAESRSDQRSSAVPLAVFSPRCEGTYLDQREESPIKPAGLHSNSRRREVGLCISGSDSIGLS
jgi:hypothetical protein